MTAPGFTESELEAAVDRLTDGVRLRDAEAHVATAAPGLQRVLAQALAAGGWFEETHRSELERIAGLGDDRERASALDLFLAEETRIAMMVGVAVGWVLADELGPPNPTSKPNPNANEEES